MQRHHQWTTTPVRLAAFASLSVCCRCCCKGTPSLKTLQQQLQSTTYASIVQTFLYMCPAVLPLAKVRHGSRHQPVELYDKRDSHTLSHPGRSRNLTEAPALLASMHCCFCVVGARLTSFETSQTAIPPLQAVGTAAICCPLHSSPVSTAQLSLLPHLLCHPPKPGTSLRIKISI